MRLLSPSNPKPFFFFLLIPLALVLQVNTSFGQAGQNAAQSTVSPQSEPVNPGISDLFKLQSPLSQWGEGVRPEPVIEFSPETEIQKTIILEVRTLSFTAGEELTLSNYFKPGTFEVISGSSPSQQPIATNQGESPVQTISFDPVQSETKIATSIRSTQVSNPVALARVSQEGLVELLRKVQHHNGVELSQMPTMSVYPGQAFTASDVASRPFVVGVQDKGFVGALAMQPVIQLIEDGLTFRARPDIVQGKIELLADIANTQITDVETYAFPQFAKADPDSGLQIQIPEVTRDTVHLATAIENNETLFIDAMLTRKETITTKANRFAKPKQEEIETRIFLLVTAKIVEQAPVEELLEVLQTENQPDEEAVTVQLPKVGFTTIVGPVVPEGGTVLIGGLKPKNLRTTK